MSAVHAIENAFGITVDGPLRALRRLLYCGEWIESHALHIVLLHAPDFLGFPDAISMAATHGEAVRRGLALKKAGNELLRLLGGREIHPVNVRVGGFYRVPTRAELAALVPSLRSGARTGDRAGPLGRRLSVPGVRTRLRVRGLAPSGRVSAERGPHRLQPRPRHRRGRVRRHVRGTPCRRIRPRCNRCCARAATTWSGRSPGST